MTIETRARRIRRALSKVAKRIPRDDWDRIRAFVSDLRAEREWQLGGFGGLSLELNSSGAALYPLFDNFPKDAKASHGRIVLNLPVCRLFSDAALIGLLAHECAHARAAAGLGPHWHAKMQRRYNANEREADTLAAKWGFGAEIGALKRERRERLTPWFAEHEETIARHVMRRIEAAEEKVRARFEALESGRGD